MAKKLINTDVVLGENTILKEAFRSIVTTYRYTRVTDGGGQITLGLLHKDIVLLNWRVVNPVGSYNPREIGILMWRFNDTCAASSGWWVMQMYVLATGVILRNLEITVEVQYI